ncbi:putative membrane protein [Rubricella aquisinus]|uniref:Putative membrane protein n=1 Tax=Rubricella aquisinus TaxID=2028108 RepID=A0A840WLL9_9RHOB|nr:DUF2306 domain-containing protein [Rubricella aquisinus]MBB5515949.1 putative membrane protein [Rubricella aquisinus]
MSLEPLLSQSPAVIVHVILMTGVTILTPVMFLLPKGNRHHRLLGKAWAGMMMGGAVSSLFISSDFYDWHFGPIHLLSFAIIFGLPGALREARAGKWRAHRSGMIQMTIGGVVIAGGLALMPTRTMNLVLFGG